MSSKVSEKGRYELSRKQLRILKLIGQGLTERAVADELNLSVNTIKYHKRVVFDQLKVGSIIEAVIKALKLGLISVNEINV